MRWALAWAVSVAVLAGAQPTNTLNETVTLVRDALQDKQPDNQLAKVLHKVKLSERLDERTFEELQSLGPGPKVLAELERLQESSEKLPPAAGPSLFEAPPTPPLAVQAQIMKEARAIALNYTSSLPDFVAMELVKRYADDKGFFQLKDTLTIKLSYFDQAESYKVLSINGHPSTVPYEEIGGTITQGEFGSLLKEVFDRHSDAELKWDHWTTLRGRPAYVFTFRVLVQNSRYTMVVGNRTGRDTIIAGQHGFVYVDRDTNQIMRIVAEADSIPIHFPVRNSKTQLDYGFADVGGRQFLLPLRAEVRMGTPSLQTRNEVEFQAYKKFTADTSITFEGAVPDKPAK